MLSAASGPFSFSGIIFRFLACLFSVLLKALQVIVSSFFPLPVSFLLRRETLPDPLGVLFRLLPRASAFLRPVAYRSAGGLPRDAFYPLLPVLFFSVANHPAGSVATSMTG